MSKSLGNGVDPMDVIDEYGADALRFYLSTSTAPGMDLRYDMDKVVSTWNFINKLWNASRFVLMNLEGFEESDITYNDLSACDKWILTKLNQVIEVVRKHMETYDFNVVGSELYSFIWDDFCDWYIELSKGALNKTTQTVLLKVLTDILKMLHPFMPYVTEEIYGMLPIHEDTIMLSAYPVYDSNLIFENEKDELDVVLDFIRRLRHVKLENQIKDYQLVYYDNQKFERYTSIISKILKLEGCIHSTMDDCLKFEKIDLSFDGSLISIYYDGSLNVEKEKENMLRDQKRLMQSIERRKGLLANDSYVSKAPQNVVENERLMLSREEQELSIILEKLNSKN